MTDWRLAKSLAVLRDQVNASAPGRSKENDGTIGDAEHSTRTSDHNQNAAGVVTAIDFTHDPNCGFDSYKFAERLRVHHDRRIKYVISNGRIFSSTKEPWQWRPYSGSNPHSKHVHVSVSPDRGLYDDESPWDLEPHMPPASNIPAPEWERGKGSWYSQHEGKYSWVDKGDRPNSNALGVPDSKQGCAFYSRATLGQWFDVQAPNGVVLNLQQTDIGPHPSTGRAIDIAAVAAERFGYTPTNFPTDAIFKWRPHKEATTMPEDIKLPPAAPYADALAELIVARLQDRIAKPEAKQSMTAMLSTLFGGLVTQSPFVGIGLFLLQQYLASAGMVGTLAGATATPTAQNMGTTAGAVVVGGLLNWVRQFLQRPKPEAQS